MRIVLGCAVAISALLISHEVYLIRKRELIATDEMIAVTQMLITYVNYGSYDVYQMCEIAFSGRDYFDYDCIFKCSDVDFPNLWNMICSGIPDCNAKDYFIDIGSVLGSCDAESQTARLGYILELLIKERDSVSLKLANDKKLIYSIGSFIGIALGLILI